MRAPPKPKPEPNNLLGGPYKREIRRQIGDVLRNSYDPVVRQPLPSEWLKLLDALNESRPSPTPETTLDAGSGCESD